MKKSIIIICAVFVTLSLTAFSVINWNDSVSGPDTLEAIVIEDNEVVAEKTIYGPFTTKIENEIFTDFIYDVGPRFGTTITKEDLYKATSVLDIVPVEAEHWWKESFQTVMIAVLEDKDEIRVMGDDKELNAAQIELLQATDYSTNFYIKARSKNKYPEDYAYYLTIVPEKQAIYLDGHDALKKYLKENSKETRINANVEPEKLQPAKLFFTVTKNGTIENVRLDRSSNYPSVDKTMIELITKAPGKWQPAENANGEKVDQELVVSFGLMGC